MRMRSPSSAPPLLRRVGSMLITAMRSASSWSRRRRRISSSVRLHLPAPPVPVMPSTGVLRLGRCAMQLGLQRASATWPFSSAVISCASARQAASRGPRIAARRLRRVRRQVVVAAHHHLADHAGQAHALAVFGAVDAGHAVGLQLVDLGRHDDAAAAAEDLDVRAAALPQQVDHVLEVLDVAALVAADGDALHVFLQRGGDDLVDRAVVAEVDDLGAHALQDAPHDVDRRVVAVEQRCGGDEAHLVRRAVVGQGLVFGGQVGHGGVGRSCRGAVRRARRRIVDLSIMALHADTTLNAAARRAHGFPESAPRGSGAGSTPGRGA